MYLSKELRQFLTEWYVHATQAEQTPPFQNHAGLCTNVILWCDYYNNPNRQILHNELIAVLFEEFGMNDYPFGRDDYNMRSRTNTQQYNYKRVQWVEKKLGISRQTAA